MVHDLALLDALERLNTEPWQGRVFRHMLGSDDFDSIPWEPCQRVGGAVAWLGHDGMLIPLVRDGDGSNLVIFTASQPASTEVVVRGSHGVG